VTLWPLHRKPCALSRLTTLALFYSCINLYLLAVSSIRVYGWRHLHLSMEYDDTFLCLLLSVVIPDTHSFGGWLILIWLYSSWYWLLLSHLFWYRYLRLCWQSIPGLAIVCVISRIQIVFDMNRPCGLLYQLMCVNKCYALCVWLSVSSVTVSHVGSVSHCIKWLCVSFLNLK